MKFGKKFTMIADIVKTHFYLILTLFTIANYVKIVRKWTNYNKVNDKKYTHVEISILLIEKSFREDNITLYENVHCPREYNFNVAVFSQ